MIPRALALQGVGFSPTQLALQGFAADPIATVFRPRQASAGGAGYGGPGSQIRLSDWLAWRKKRAISLSDPEVAATRKRQAQEDELLALGIA